MAAHAMHYPRKRRWPLRLLGFLATIALLGSGAAIAYMVLPAKDETPAIAAKPRTAVKGETKAKPLTKAQKRARREAVAKLTGEGYEPVRLADWRPRAPFHCSTAMKTVIAVDAMGGDHGPSVTVPACLDFLASQIA